MGSSQSVTISSASSIQERPERTEIPARPVTACYPEEPKLRVCFGTGAGGFVQGFPSNGGVYMLSCSAMELDFLGLDRFETALPSADPAEEDSLCAKMRLLGPEWWPSLEACNKAGWQDFLHQGQHSLEHYREERVRFFGVASQGGVWALETGGEECSSRQLGRINNARDMEEKCRQIEKFGGTFYAAPSECPLLDFKSPFPERAAVHVLLADGDASNQEVARSLMAELGFSQVTTVGDGKEALGFLLAAAEDKTQRKPDILLVNTELPVMDGFECARLLRFDFSYSQHYPHIPIVAMPHHTMLGDNKLQERSVGTGLSGFVPRPIQKEQLERTLVKWTLKGPRRFLLSGPSVEDARRGARVMKREY
ncbi:CheY-like superfamily [Chaetomidium leptoderma]|uniref:CheY-like superfamily n=1 Tax=Chaetomidium leptoderma TaxID=669021 RepID=A0AAN6VKJ6_9PEZI|nr:CheY-like superfamily [Chaetomidium leptoderma]